ncbi:sialate O-acetylesterase [Pontibacter akesuensis]|uniref:Sialate O-acetylesterase n=2 Tax=Pontibacter akesuensis TaxID=388950 RepID=A0A1I7KXE0_9BACT|nr:sialate O-acetylesterase [Pontibacter akesuensis]
MRKSITCLCIALVMCSLSPLFANVGLPAIFNSHMILQQKAEVVIWGWGKAQEPVSVTTSWNQQTVKTETNPNGQWRVTVNTPAAGGPYSITVQGYNTIKLEDVLIGEVWLVSGQSNMEWSARAGIDNAEEAVRGANHPNIRFFNVQHRTADAPQLDLGGQWVPSTPETMIDFSAIAYFFGRELHQELDVPIGLINSSWGGTPAEVWVAPEVTASDPGLAEAAKKIAPMEWAPHEPGKTYHAMLAPLIPYRIAGVLWYQGETNTAAPQSYARLFPALINRWRSEWGYDFPFYYAQIAPFKYGRPLEGVLLRDAQRKALSVPGTGMVVTSDIGNINDIHPRNKQDVGKRFANLALNKTYGRKNLPFSGPLYREMKTEGSKVRLYFDHAENGLVMKGKQLTHFEIAGEDQQFVPAKARVDGKTLVVSAPGVKKPVAVRFAWSNTAEPNLFNKEGLPASSFRTDDWPIPLQ